MDIISEGKNHKSVSLGKLDKLKKHSFKHPLFKHTDEGRIFLGEILGTSGAEISLREIPAGTSIPFLHRHKHHEEIYVFLKGRGRFQVDDSVFIIEEGSVVKVDPVGSRTLSNDGTDAMVYMVVQASVNSLKGYHVSDGFRIEDQYLL